MDKENTLPERSEADSVWGMVAFGGDHAACGF